ncbi:hypothetical protein H0Z60_02120 [Ectothiorhodospiraceae bacterium WFHF3C12]|nr:hypothetical protein [Ectothiorhodospiraceae bacterium WFHF3C12]
MSENEDVVSDDILISVSEYLNQDIKFIRDKTPRFSADPCHCDSCGVELTFLDFVKTAHATDQHSKKFMSDFFEQSKSMKKEFNTVIICGNCQRAVETYVIYQYVNYCPI